MVSPKVSGRVVRMYGSVNMKNCGAVASNCVIYIPFCREGQGRVPRSLLYEGKFNDLC